MISAKTDFESFLKGEVNKVKGVYFPVKSSYLRQIIGKKVPITKLHPNPSDEFCNPEIGPNYEIISRYEADFRHTQGNFTIDGFGRSGAAEPLICQKAAPDGYLILNGHHRWAAALRAGITHVIISIVNLTQEKDIERMLNASSARQRVSLDLDEVVFVSGNDVPMEKPLGFPWSRLYKERVRFGLPALFYTLNTKEYDIWVYTSKYYSYDYLRHFFRHSHLPVSGIVTGAGRNNSDPKTAEAIRKQFEVKYTTNVHIDSKMVVRTSRDSAQYEDYPLSGSPDTWSREVLEIVEGWHHHG